MDRRRSRNIGHVAERLGDWFYRENLRRNCNRRSGHRITDTGVRRHRRVPLMEGKSGQKIGRAHV